MALISKALSNWFISMCEKLSFNNQHELLIRSVKLGDYDIAKYLIEEKCGDDVFDKIAEMRLNGGGILHCVVDQIAHQQSSLLKFVLVNNVHFLKDITNFIRFVDGKDKWKLNERIVVDVIFCLHFL